MNRPTSSAPGSTTRASGSTPTACARPAGRTPTGSSAPTTTPPSSPPRPTRRNITFDLYNALTYDFFGAHRAAHNGDHQLPGNLPDGTGEVAEVRLAVDGNDLLVRLLWNSFPLTTAQVATLTFGSASDPVTPWPRNARLSGHWSAALTLSGIGGSLTRGGSTVPVRTSATGHVVEARVPLAELPAGPWRLQGGSGLGGDADLTGGTGVAYRDVPAGEASATEPGSGGPTSPTNVWGLLFAGDTPWSFDELSQSRQLSRGRRDVVRHRGPCSADGEGDAPRAPAARGPLAAAALAANPAGTASARTAPA